MDTSKQSPKMLQLVAKTSSSNDDYNGDCDWAVVEITKAEVDMWLQKIRLMRGLAGMHDRLLSMDWADGSVWYFSEPDEIDALQKEKIDIGGNIGMYPEEMFLAHRDVVAQYFPDDKAQRTEMGRLCVDEGSLRFEACVKHTSVTVSVWGVSEADLLDLRAWFVAQAAKAEDVSRKTG